MNSNAPSRNQGPITETASWAYDEDVPIPALTGILVSGGGDAP